MRFCTVINCMDGRVQIPVIDYLRRRFDVDSVDSVTEPGPNLILAEHRNHDLVESILRRVTMSIDNHFSVAVAIVGHFDCAGNPASREEQLGHLRDAVLMLRRRVELPIIALWVDERWRVIEIPVD